MKLFDAIRAEKEVWKNSKRTDSAGFWSLIFYVVAWITSGFYLWNKLPVEANGIFSLAMASLVRRFVSFVVRVHQNPTD